MHDDKVMRTSIRIVFSNACYRLCTRHLRRNAHKYVCNMPFFLELGAFMYGDLGIYDFESRWRVVAHELNLEKNKCVRQMYKMGHMWCTAYLKSTFFIRMRTT